MSFNQTYTIQNLSNYTLTLDTVGSNNLGDTAWPTTIAPHSTPPSFTQSSSVNVNPTAVYTISSSPPISAYLHFYCWGAGAVHVNMTMQFSSGPLFVGCSIAENNTNNGKSFETSTAMSDNVEILDISINAMGSSRGTAIFVIGGG